MPFGYTDKTFNTYSCVYNNNIIIMMLRVIIQSFLFIYISFVFNVYYFFMTGDKNVCIIFLQLKYSDYNNVMKEEGL